MLKPVTTAHPESLAARAARRASEARTEGQAALQDLMRRAEEISHEAKALAALDIAPGGVRQAAERFSREAMAFTNGSGSIPWR
jgi:hypothetical protein